MSEAELREKFEKAKIAAKAMSVANGNCAQHVNVRFEIQNGVPVVTGFLISDWFDDSTAWSA